MGLFKKKERKCSTRTYELQKMEAKAVMAETKKYLSELRKQVA